MLYMILAHIQEFSANFISIQKIKYITVLATVLNDAINPTAINQTKVIRVQKYPL